MSAARTRARRTYRGTPTHRPHWESTVIGADWDGTPLKDWWIYCSCDWSAGPFRHYQSAIADHRNHVEDARLRRERNR